MKGGERERARYTVDEENDNRRIEECARGKRERARKKKRKEK